MFFIMILMMTIQCFLMIRLYIKLYSVAFCSTIPSKYMWHFAVFINSSGILQYLCAPKLHFVVLQSLQFEVAFCSNVLNLSASFQRNDVPLQGRIQPLLKGGGSNKTCSRGVRGCHPPQIQTLSLSAARSDQPNEHGKLDNFYVTPR